MNPHMMGIIDRFVSRRATVLRISNSSQICSSRICSFGFVTRRALHAVAHTPTVPTSKGAATINAPIAQTPRTQTDQCMESACWTAGGCSSRLEVAVLATAAGWFEIPGAGRRRLDISPGASIDAIGVWNPVDISVDVEWPGGAFGDPANGREIRKPGNTADSSGIASASRTAPVQTAWRKAADRFRSSAATPAAMARRIAPLQAASSNIVTVNVKSIAPRVSNMITVLPFVFARSSP